MMIAESLHADSDVRALISKISLLDDAINFAGLVLWELDLPNEKVTYNAAFSNLFDVRATENCRPLSDILEHVVADDRTLASAYFQAIDQNSSQTTFRISHPDGSFGFVSGKSRTVHSDQKGNTLRTSGYLMDVTTNENLINSFLETQRRLEFALSATDLGLWDCDLKNGFVLYDERWCSMLGYQQHEIGNDFAAWTNLIHPGDRQNVEHAVNAHMNGETDFYRTEHRLRHKQGHWVWVLARGRIVERNGDGIPTRATGTNEDITHQKRLASEGPLLLQQIESLLSKAINPGITPPQTSASEAIEKLSRRQQEILELVTQGNTSSEIAKLLAIAPSTVITHRRDMMKKLGAKTAAELGRLYQTHKNPHICG